MTIKEAMYNAMCGKCIPYKKEVKKVFNEFIRINDDSLKIYKDRIHELNCEIERLQKIIEDDGRKAHWNKRKIKEGEKVSIKRLFKNGYAYECSNCLLCEPYNHIGQYCRGCGCKMEGVRDESERND